ncbi:M3 family oligoendopeptidase [Engelhardtia mirabilis]|uniref:Peptidase family M3 n=1 Tax=Engelhardtia mirabilis TaxID=2528011 RepID=A0A518BE40_9BACT|nr:Peptidase family M3 [Planctomycetes bacterium Pla133]QDU99469.1 Peptidase family M3 [Planctomycetes bacterium Pla86]
MSTLAFADLAPATPDLDDLAARTRGMLDSLVAAQTTPACLEILRDWDAMRREVQTYASWVRLRFQQDTADAERKAARERWDGQAPRWTELQIDVERAVLNHPCRAGVEAEVGPQALALWESKALAFDPAILEDLVEESRLESEYVALLAGAEFDFKGQAESLSTILRFRQSADREERHGAERAQWGWFADNAGELDRIFDDLVALRHRMAGKLGFDDFVSVGYKRMCRVDYDQGDVERFRAAIVRDVVPLATALHERQARDLGLEKLMAWDETVHDLAGNPAPRGDRAWMMERAREMFDAMGPELGGFFRTMDDGGFLDLDSRKGKAGGGFCTSFPSAGMPFIFANFNGSKGDVEVFTHEVGHAFQNFSSRGLWPMDVQWPTSESAEIHSMSLELLTWPHMEGFFGDDAERFRRVHLTESLLFLPYGTAVDHFQHEVYRRPEMTPAERNEVWLEMERTYLPWRQWGDLAHPAGGGRWQQQRHIYLYPFYYIDYVLAQTCALQLWAQAEEDRDAAMGAYLALCRRGGSAPFQELVRGAGLVSPFDEGCLASVVDRAKSTLGL